MLSDMSLSKLFQTVDISDHKALCSLYIDDMQINQASAKLSEEQADTLFDNVNQFKCDEPSTKPLTKLQQMLMSSSNLSSKFIADKFNNETIQELLPTYEDTAQELDDLVESSIQKIDVSTRQAQEQSAAVHIYARAPNSAVETFHHQQGSTRNFVPQNTHDFFAGISDGPSQRAAALLLSRSSEKVPRSRLPDLRHAVSVKLQHWNGSELCDDP
jgi:hypothetical protein